jgi:hypothetical protein
MSRDFILEVSYYLDICNDFLIILVCEANIYLFWYDLAV